MKSRNSSVKQNKLKKKLQQRNVQEENVLSDEDSKSSDSKKSKLIPNWFGRKHKMKDGYRQLRAVENNNSGKPDITNAIIDACEHITKSYTKSKTVSSNYSSKDEQRSNEERTSKDKIEERSGRNESSGKVSNLATRGLPAVPMATDRQLSSAAGGEVSGKSHDNVERLLNMSDEAMVRQYSQQ